jgi:hypothetical protein
MQFNPVLLQTLIDVLITLNIMISPPLHNLIHDVFASIHRIFVVPMVMIVGLYCIFRQKRPAVVIATQRPLGTAYGMPSGDSLFSAMIALLAFPKNPIFATLLFLSVGSSRVIRGYHTVLQVIVGWGFGALTGIAWRAGGNYFTIGNWMTSVILPILAWFDPNLKSIPEGEFNSLTVWVLMNFGTWMFDFLVCAPKEVDIFASLSLVTKLSVAWILNIVAKVVGRHLISKGKTISFAEKTETG